MNTRDRKASRILITLITLDAHHNNINKLSHTVVANRIHS